MSIHRVIVLVFGVVYVLVGILGFIPGITTAAQVADAPSATGAIFGIFAVNLLHNLVHLVIGLALLYGATSTANAINVARGVGIVYVLVGILGFIQPDTFGLMPIGGNDIWLHLASAAVLLIVGFALPPDREMRTA